MSLVPGALAVLLLLAAGAGASTAPPAARVPVLVELFTSEGCSSCPPADALLRRLASQQPVPGAEIVPLAFHVDYWNRLGWTDPYSSPEASARQQERSRQLSPGRVYTPQAVVNGRAEMVGSDTDGLRQAVAAAAARRGLPIAVTIVPGSSPIGGATVRVTLEGPAPEAEGALVRLAITESGIEQHVDRGENASRDLVHDGVVRTFVKLGAVADGRFEDQRALKLDAAWNRQQLAAVAWLEDPETGAVLGVARAALSP